MTQDSRLSNKPIIFTTKMVNAALAGTKNQTRRAVTSANTVNFSVKKKLLDFTKIYPNGNLGIKVQEKDSEALWRGRCKWQPDDLLYVRETWKPKSWSEDGDNWLITYKADGSDYLTKSIFDDEDKEQKFFIKLSDELIDAGCPEKDGMLQNVTEYLNWRPSIFLPKNASRIWLNVKDVRVERVQDISEEDAIKEGIDVYKFEDAPHDCWQIPGYPPTPYASVAFSSLWDSINAKRNGGIYAWDKNPWVWVVDFELRSKQGLALRRGCSGDGPHDSRLRTHDYE